MSLIVRNLCDIISSL